MYAYTTQLWFITNNHHSLPSLHCFCRCHCPPPTLTESPLHPHSLGVITNLSAANHLSSSHLAPSPRQRYSTCQSQSRCPHPPHNPATPSATIASATLSLIFAAHRIEIARVGEVPPFTSAFSPEKFLPSKLTFLKEDSFSVGDHGCCWRRGGHTWLSDQALNLDQWERPKEHLL